MTTDSSRVSPLIGISLAKIKPPSYWQLANTNINRGRGRNIKIWHLIPIGDNLLEPPSFWISHRNGRSVKTASQFYSHYSILFVFTLQQVLIQRSLSNKFLPQDSLLHSFQISEPICNTIFKASFKIIPIPSTSSTRPVQVFVLHNWSRKASKKAK